MVNGKLHITKPNRHQNGLYTCIAHNSIGSIISRNGYNLNASEYLQDEMFEAADDVGSSYLYRLKRGDTTNKVKLAKTQLNVNENDNATLNCGIGLSSSDVQRAKHIQWHKDRKPFKEIELGSNEIHYDIDQIHISKLENVMPREDGMFSFALYLL